MKRVHEWTMAQLTIFAGTVGPLQPEAVFRYFYCVTTVEEFRDEMVPILRGIMARCTLIGEPPNLGRIAGNLALNYGEKHQHVIAIVKGPDDNDMLVQYALSVMGDWYELCEVRGIKQTLLFQPNMFAVMLDGATISHKRSR